MSLMMCKFEIFDTIYISAYSEYIKNNEFNCI